MVQVVGEVQLRVTPITAGFEKQTQALFDRMGQQQQKHAASIQVPKALQQSLPDQTVKFNADITGFSAGIQSAITKLAEFTGVAFLATRAVSYLKDAFIGFNATEQNVRVALTQITGSLAGAQSALNQFNAFALQSPFQYRDIIGWGQQLMALGATATQATAEMTALGDATARLGNIDPQRMGALVNIFGQAMTSGQLTGGDISYLTQMGINAKAILSQQLGIPMYALMQGNVPISAAQGIPALTAGMEAQSKGMMQKMATSTFTGAMSNIKDAADQLMGAFTGGTAGSSQNPKNSIFSGLTAGVVALSEKLQAVTQDIKSHGIKQALADLFPSSLQGTIKSIIDNISKLIPVISQIGKSMATGALSSFGAAFAVIATAVQGVLDVATPLLTFLSHQKTLVEALTAAIVAYVLIMKTAAVVTAVSGFVGGIGAAGAAGGAGTAAVAGVAGSGGGVGSILARGGQAVFGLGGGGRGALGAGMSQAFTGTGGSAVAGTALPTTTLEALGIPAIGAFGKSIPGKLKSIPSGLKGLAGKFGKSTPTLEERLGPAYNGASTAEAEAAAAAESGAAGGTSVMGAAGTVALPAAIVAGGIYAGMKIRDKLAKDKISKGLKSQLNDDVSKATFAAGTNDFATINASVNDLTAHRNAINAAGNKVSSFNPFEHGQKMGFRAAAQDENKTIDIDKAKLTRMTGFLDEATKGIPGLPGGLKEMQPYAAGIKAGNVGDQQKAYDNLTKLLAGQGIDINTATVAQVNQGLMTLATAETPLGQAMVKLQNPVTALTIAMDAAKAMATDFGKALDSASFKITELLGAGASTSASGQTLIAGIQGGRGAYGTSTQTAAVGFGDTSRTTGEKMYQAGASPADVMAYLGKNQTQIDTAAANSGMSPTDIARLNNAAGLSTDLNQAAALGFQGDKIDTGIQAARSRITTDDTTKRVSGWGQTTSVQATDIKIVNDGNAAVAALTRQIDDLKLKALGAAQATNDAALALQDQQKIATNRVAFTQQYGTIGQGIGSGQAAMGLAEAKGGPGKYSDQWMQGYAAVFQGQQDIVSHSMAMTSSYQAQLDTLNGAMGKLQAGTKLYNQYAEQRRQIEIQLMQYNYSSMAGFRDQFAGILTQMDSTRKSMMGNNFNPYQLPDNPILGAGTLTNFADTLTTKIDSWSGGLKSLESMGLTRGAEQTLGLTAGPQENLQVQALLKATPAEIAKLNASLTKQQDTAQAEAWREQGKIIGQQVRNALEAFSKQNNTQIVGGIENLVSTIIGTLTGTDTSDPSKIQPASTKVGQYTVGRLPQKNA